MKKALIFISLMVSLFVSAKTIEMKSPVFLFNLLLDCPTEKSMIQCCERNDMTYNGITSGFHTYSYKDGTVISFRMDTLSSGVRVPVIDIRIEEKEKDLEKIINSLGYSKEGSEYYKGSKFSKMRSVVTIMSDPKDKTVTVQATKKMN